MKPILIIALNTYREIIRDRILYGIIVFGVLLIGLSLALGQLSFAERVRITTSFGLTAIQLSAVVLSIFLGSSLVAKEIEKKTIMTLLVRPVTRVQFLLGKSAGLLLVQLTVMTSLAAILALIYWSMGVELLPQHFLVLHGIFLEAIVLLAIALFFSIFSTPMMVVAFTVAFFLVGHWLDGVSYFVKKSDSEVLKLFGKFAPSTLPNLEVFNWQTAVVYSDPIPASMVGSASLYAGFWFLFLLAASVLIFRRKDFA